MHIHMEDGQQAFADFLELINIGIMEHDEWLCTHIHDPNLNLIMRYGDFLSPDEVVLAYYLDDMDGQFFITSSQDIYLVSKELSISELEGLAYQISDLIQADHSLETRVEVCILSDQCTVFEGSGSFNGQQFQKALLKSQRAADGRIQREGMNNIIDFMEYKTRKVLLVEDDRTTRNMVKAAMEEVCDMVTASDVSRGLTTFLKIEPDIVFLDIGLPDGDGHQMLDFMIRHNPDAYIVMFSACDDENNVNKALDHGARGFISKPFIKDAMLEHLRQQSSLEVA